MATKKCPRCAHFIEVEAYYCKYCDTEFRVPVVHRKKLERKRKAIKMMLSAIVLAGVVFGLFYSGLFEEGSALRAFFTSQAPADSASPTNTDTGSDASSDSDKPDLNIGDYVQFGQYYGKPIKWRVIHKDENGDPVLFSDKILTIKAFDAAGIYHSNEYRMNSGSNFYEHSNLRQWLNSSSISIEWKQNPPDTINMSDGNNPYADEKGFLADGNFTAVERSLLKPVKHKVLLSQTDMDEAVGGSEWHKWANETPDKSLQNYDLAFYQTVEDKVFPLSVKQLKEWVFDQQTVLGEDWYIGEPTAEAVENSTYKNNVLNESQKWLYWLNTPGTENSNVVRIVYPDGKIYHSGAGFDIIGVRPALQLRMSAAIVSSAGAGSESDPFLIQPL